MRQPLLLLDLLLSFQRSNIFADWENNRDTCCIALYQSSVNRSNFAVSVYIRCLDLCLGKVDPSDRTAQNQIYKSELSARFAIVAYAKKSQSYLVISHRQIKTAALSKSAVSVSALRLSPIDIIESPQLSREG